VRLASCRLVVPVVPDLTGHRAAAVGRHLLHRHHTPDFWAALSLVLPDYEERREGPNGRSGERLVWWAGGGLICETWPATRTTAASKRATPIYAGLRSKVFALCLLTVDYLRYAETAEPRFPLIFYGLMPALDAGKDLSPLVDVALKRGRELSPAIAGEYRRIDFASGIGRFDDRSTAFGVASVSFSHAVTDVTLALRRPAESRASAFQRSDLPP
jgi:hypothetical protein